MGRVYAGILGSLAMATMLAQGLRQGGAAVPTLANGVLALLAFALIGFVSGELAGWIVKESVQSQMAAQVAAQERTDSAPNSSDRTLNRAAR